MQVLRKQLSGAVKSEDKVALREKSHLYGFLFLANGLLVAWLAFDALLQDDAVHPWWLALFSIAMIGFGAYASIQSTFAVHCDAGAVIIERGFGPFTLRKSYAARDVLRFNLIAKGNRSPTRSWALGLELRSGEAVRLTLFKDYTWLFDQVSELNRVLNDATRRHKPSVLTSHSEAETPK